MQAVFDQIRARAVEALVLTFAVASVVEVFLAEDLSNRGLFALLALGWTIPFAFLRRFPLWAPTLVAGSIALAAFIDGDSIDKLTMPYVAALVAAVSFGLIADRAQRVAGWTVIVGPRLVMTIVVNNCAMVPLNMSPSPVVMAWATF